ncbi:Rpn family recombination-promoting nuclease/putative transposase [Sporofaciens sp. SGI.106]|uniref:Rpn family recombination-promoting nuclease/putative transposase n=1 Tax=Sporofaciens sp. SGI.106 TaxID=3420568 RepID=UPI003D08BB9F
MEKRKNLRDLNLLDRFLFAEAMEDPVIVKSVLEIVLGKEIALKYLPHTEKEQRTSPLKRFVKLDVWAWDTDDVVYDTEVQKEDTKNLPKRSRLYQAMIDVKLLEPGEIDFNRLNKVFVIMITPFDLFGKGLYKYTFEMKCKERPEISLEDDATRIFLNTRGTNAGEVSEELVELLHYIEHTSEEVSNRCQSNRIKDMQRRIEAIKSSEEVGVRYMQAWEEKILVQRKAREEGIEQGRTEGIEQGRTEGIEQGRVEGTIMTLVETYREFGMSKEDTVTKVINKCQISSEDAWKYVKQYWK